MAGSCDRNSGECLKCLNNTTGRFCESCLAGFYRNPSTSACKREDRVQVPLQDETSKDQL